MKKICLLWDFDGTLAYRDGLWTASLSAVLESNGYSDFDRNLISETMQPKYPWAKHEMAHAEYFNDLSWWEYIEKCVVARALNAIGITQDKENERLTGSFKDEYLRLDAWYLFDDTLRNLERSIDAGYDNVILSNHTPELAMLAENLNISQYFKHIITSALVGYEKPNPKFYDIIKTFKGYDEYYMIGDNYKADILGAKSYGLNAIMVRKENAENYPLYAESLDGVWEFIDLKKDISGI